MTQRNFIPINPPPPSLDALRGDTRSTADLRPDPLPLPPGWTDSADPDAAGVPPESLTPGERRLIAHMESVQERLLADLAATDRPTAPTGPPYSAPGPPPRYVEGLAHGEDWYRPSQGVPDAWGRSREKHLLAKALQSMDDRDPEAIDARERAEFGVWFRDLMSEAGVVLALVVCGAVIAAAAVLGRGR